LEFMVHDGDQNQTGGDAGENCVGVRPICAKAADCNDQNACTSDSCVSGLCQYTNIPGCRLCSTAADCDDQNACTVDSCDAGVCHNTAVTCTSDTCNTRTCNGTASCTVTPKTGAACDDGNTCSFNDTCNSGGQCAGTAITCTSDQCNTRT